MLFETLMVMLWRELYLSVAVATAASIPNISTFTFYKLKIKARRGKLNEKIKNTI